MTKFEIISVSIIPVAGYWFRKLLRKIFKRRAENVTDDVLSTQIDQAITQVEKIRKMAFRAVKKHPIKKRPSKIGMSKKQ